MTLPDAAVQRACQALVVLAVEDAEFLARESLEASGAQELAEAVRHFVGQPGADNWSGVGDVRAALSKWEEAP